MKNNMNLNEIIEILSSAADAASEYLLELFVFACFAVMELTRCAVTSLPGYVRVQTIRFGAYCRGAWSFRSDLIAECRVYE